MRGRVGVNHTAWTIFGFHRYVYAILVLLHFIVVIWQSNHLACLDSEASPVLKPAVDVKLALKEKVFQLPRGLQISVDDHIRVFPKRAFPCIPAEDNWNTLAVQKSPAVQGFLYVKARKASSSTLAGVAIRVARRVAKDRRMQMCKIRFNHPMASKLNYGKRVKLESFLWSVVREPSRRFMSEFFHFGFSRNFVQPTDENIKKYMRETTPPIDNYYLRWLSVNEPFDAARHRPEAVVRDIIQEYDFLGVSERLDESLVVLQMILDLRTSDLLYLSAKLHGGWDDGVYRHQCYFITPAFVSSSMQKFFETSEEWFSFSYGDDLLYRAVNASLDRTIAGMDPAIFSRNIQRLRWALNKADEICRSQVVFPCSENGKYVPENDCLIWDSACGMDCLDELARTLDL
jgi:Galactose-3-O-sulfotransferase